MILFLTLIVMSAGFLSFFNEFTTFYSIFDFLGACMAADFSLIVSFWLIYSACAGLIGYIRLINSAHQFGLCR